MKPNLKIENPRVEDADSSSGSKDVSFDVHNHGRWGVENFRVQVKVNLVIPELKLKPASWIDFKTLNPNFPSKPEPFNLDPRDKVPVRLCLIVKNARNALLYLEGKSYPLPMGQAYELEIRFIGKNFSDGRIWRMQLNLNYENVQSGKVLTFCP